LPPPAPIWASPGLVKVTSVPTGTVRRDGSIEAVAVLSRTGPGLAGAAGAPGKRCGVAVF